MRAKLDENLPFEAAELLRAAGWECDTVGAIVFLQGVLVRRPSRIHVTVAMQGAEIRGVKVGGSAVVVGEGTMTF